MDNRPKLRRWFWWSCLLTLVTFVWVVLDDYFKEWKLYARGFKTQAAAVAHNDYRQAEKEFLNSPEYKLYQEAIKKLKSEKQRLNDPKLKKSIGKAEKELRRKEKKALMAKQRHTFAKSRQEAAYYLYKHALHSGHKYAKEKEKWQKLAAKEEKLLKEKEAALEKLKESQERLDSLLSGKMKLENEINKLTRDVDRLKGKAEELKPTLANYLNEIRRELPLFDFINPPKRIAQHLAPDLKKVDRCATCHAGIDRSGFEKAGKPFTSHPQRELLLGNHPPEKFGCTVCHLGQGRGTTFQTAAHTPPNEETRQRWEKAYQWEELEFWQEKMLPGKMVQASCLKCHAKIDGLPGAEKVTIGKELFGEKRCFACHLVEGYQPEKERPFRWGPRLDRIGEKVQYDWILPWLKNPRSYLEKTAMPNFRFKEEEVRDIANFLFSLSESREAPEKKLEEKEAETLYEEGKFIFAQAQCILCHTVEGEGGTTGLGPELSGVGNKVRKSWVKTWLKDPRDYFPLSIMPQFNFTDRQLEAITTYIMAEMTGWESKDKGLKAPAKPEISSLQNGERLVRKYGCFACHQIKGTEKLSRIGAELTVFGQKERDKLDWGDTHIPKTWKDWTFNKLKDPRIYETEKIELRMPDFSLTEEEISSLLIFLQGLGESAIPEKYQVRAEHKEIYQPPGRFGKVLSKHQCFSCHHIRNRGGVFAPDLSVVGSKIKGDWIRQFLEKPSIIRPLLKQMPQMFVLGKEKDWPGNMPWFAVVKEDIDAVVNYMKVALVTTEIPENYQPVKEKAKEGERLFRDKSCFTCHQMGGSGGIIGPVLTKLRERLEPGYILEYLKNPHRFRPQAVEPRPGLSDNEREALVAYLLYYQSKGGE